MGVDHACGGKTLSSRWNLRGDTKPPTLANPQGRKLKSERYCPRLNKPPRFCLLRILTQYTFRLLKLGETVNAQSFRPLVLVASWEWLISKNLRHI